MLIFGFSEFWDFVAASASGCFSAFRVFGHSRFRIPTYLATDPFGAFENLGWPLIRFRDFAFSLVNGSRNGSRLGHLRIWGGTLFDFEISLFRLPTDLVTDRIWGFENLGWRLIGFIPATLCHMPNGSQRNI